MAVAEHNTLWRRVVENNKYVSLLWGGGGCYNSVHGLYGVCLLKNIRKGWETFKCFISIKFWHDSWCVGLPLRESFSEIFRIAHDRDTSVEELLSFSGEIYHWDVSFVRPV